MTDEKFVEVIVKETEKIGQVLGAKADRQSIAQIKEIEKNQKPYVAEPAKEVRLATIAYIPPPSFGNPLQFLRNLDRFPTHYPLVLFSDHEYDRPNLIKLTQSPEMVKETGNRWAVNNIIFYTALRIAIKSDYTHILYIESDSRVGRAEWDKVIFDEFFSHKDMIMGGSLVCYSPCNHSMAVARKWTELIAKFNSKRNYPIPTYGAGGSVERGQPCFLVNGSLGVYSIDWMKRVFGDGLDTTPALARASTAWDFELGVRLFNMLGLDVLDRIVHLSSVFSSYGDLLTTEQERQFMLHSGEKCAVHQIKSDWEGPEKEGPRREFPAPKPIDLLPVEVIANHEPQPKVEETPVEPKPRAAVNNKPRVEIFIVTFGRDVGYNKYCLESIKKFATGFTGVTVLVPSEDKDAFMPQCKKYGASLRTFKAAPEPLSFLDHEVQVCKADTWCPKAHFILHIDADCIFTAPVSPDDYFVDGKPVLWIEQFESFRTTDPTRYIWKAVTEQALGWDVGYETMCRHPAVHPKFLYPQVRAHIEKTHAMEFKAYVLDQKPDFPHGFAEFPTLGAYALHFLHSAYHFVDVTGRTNEEKGPSKVRQFDGRSGVGKVEAEIQRLLK